jgi:hypothetical protein
MKTLIKFALAAMMLITTLTAQAGTVSGHYRSNGTYVAPYYRSDSGSVGRSSSYSSSYVYYVYRNPYVSIPQCVGADKKAVLGARAAAISLFSTPTPTRRLSRQIVPRPQICGSWCWVP